MQPSQIKTPTIAPKTRSLEQAMRQKIERSLQILPWDILLFTNQKLPAEFTLGAEYNSNNLLQDETLTWCYTTLMVNLRQLFNIKKLKPEEIVQIIGNVVEAVQEKKSDSRFSEFTKPSFLEFILENVLLIDQDNDDAHLNYLGEVLNLFYAQFRFKYFASPDSLFERLMRLRLSPELLITLINNSDLLWYALVRASKPEEFKKLFANYHGKDWPESRIANRCDIDFIMSLLNFCQNKKKPTIKSFLTPTYKEKNLLARPTMTTTPDSLNHLEKKPLPEHKALQKEKFITLAVLEILEKDIKTFRMRINQLELMKFTHQLIQSRLQCSLQQYIKENKQLSNSLDEYSVLKTEYSELKKNKSKVIGQGRSAHDINSDVLRAISTGSRVSQGSQGSDINSDLKRAISTGSHISQGSQGSDITAVEEEPVKLTRQFREVLPAKWQGNNEMPALKLQIEALRQQLPEVKQLRLQLRAAESSLRKENHKLANRIRERAEKLAKIQQANKALQGNIAEMRALVKEMTTYILTYPESNNLVLENDSFTAEGDNEREAEAKENKYEAINNNLTLYGNNHEENKADERRTEELSVLSEEMSDDFSNDLYIPGDAEREEEEEVEKKNETFEDTFENNWASFAKDFMPTKRSFVKEEENKTDTARKSNNLAVNNNAAADSDFFNIKTKFVPLDNIEIGKIEEKGNIDNEIDDDLTPLKNNNNKPFNIDSTVFGPTALFIPISNPGDKEPVSPQLDNIALNSSLVSIESTKENIKIEEKAEEKGKVNEGMKDNLTLSTSNNNTPNKVDRNLTNFPALITRDQQDKKPAEPSTGSPWGNQTGVNKLKGSIYNSRSKWGQTPSSSASRSSVSTSNSSPVGKNKIIPSPVRQSEVRGLWQQPPTTGRTPAGVKKPLSNSSASTSVPNNTSTSTIPTYR